MQKITFVNENAPYVSAENLNQMQTNVESAINEIIETGNNSNGSWVKLKNGTLIQYGYKEYTNIAITGYDFSTLSGVVVTVNFPIEFASNDYFATASNSVDGGWVSYLGRVSSVISHVSYSFILGTKRTDPVSGACRWLAVGKWK